MVRTNPTDAIDVSFSHYLAGRKAVTESHMEGGIPDYAYGSDYVLRQKIKAIPGFYPLAKAIANTYVPRAKQEMNLHALRVGPSQFPDVYEIVSDCAMRLGIGIPTVYITHAPFEINARAYCTEDDDPLIEITSGMLERVTPGELRAVIGHECGHIHNNHGIYSIAAEMVLNSLQIAIPGIQQIMGLISAPLQWAFKMWSRAGEVSCDRAGIICSDTPEDDITLQAKLMYGAALNHQEVNIDAVLKQYDLLQDTPVRLLELENEHPLCVRRIFAMKEFLNSEVLYTWRPEWKTPDIHLIGKQELDARCEKYISVARSEKRRVKL